MNIYGTSKPRCCGRELSADAVAISVNEKSICPHRADILAGARNKLDNSDSDPCLSENKTGVMEWEGSWAALRASLRR